MRVWVCGIAGVLGSSLANTLSKEGYEVLGNDVVRREEAWRLEVEVPYLWKSTWDLTRKDLEGVDVVVDASIGFADRPFGDSSPLTTLWSNVMPIARLLEVVRRMEKKPVVVYPSSFNALYGHRLIKESCLPSPTNLYGATKGIAELLCLTYLRAYEVPVIISRVGSAFGPKGRSDELPQRLIIFALKGKKFVLRSPYAKRLWTYSKDVMEFYLRLLERLDECVGKVLHCAGNKYDEIITNVELAERIKRFLPLEYELGEYEPGEKGIDFKVDCSYTRELLGWKPKYSIGEGLKETIIWFESNLGRYRV